MQSGLQYETVLLGVRYITIKIQKSLIISVMIFLGGTKIISSCSHYCFTAERKKSFFGKVSLSLKKLLLCCFMTDKNKIPVS